jgi:hypothetical protein
MNIHQIQLAYNAQEDRILLRLSTNDRTEFRFWLTRRFVKRLWSLLRKMLEEDASFKELGEEARRAVLGMQHETFVEQGDFSKGFDNQSRQLPLGGDPVLLTTAKGKVNARGGRVLSLYPASGPGIDIALSARLLHMICKLLRDAVSRSDWDFRITLGAGSGQLSAATSRTPN